MLQLATSPVLARKLAIGGAAVAVLSAQYFFFGGAWKNRKTLYPPTNINTKNRLFPTYINSQNELHNLLLFKEPLILNFTIMADPKSNKLTQALYDVLGSEKEYPLNSNTNPCNLASISVDSEDGRDMMLTYGVNKIPSLVCLHKQMPVGRFVSSTEDIDHDELKQWIAEYCK